VGSSCKVQLIQMCRFWKCKVQKFQASCVVSVGGLALSARGCGSGWVHCKRCNFAHFSATVVQLQILPMGGGRRIPLFLGSDVTFSRLGGARPLQPLYTAIWYWFSSTRMQHDLCSFSVRERHTFGGGGGRVWPRIPTGEVAESEADGRTSSAAQGGQGARAGPN
jgi:hypothetical protein